MFPFNMPFSIHHTAVVPNARNVPRLKSGACALLPLAWSTSVSRHAVLVVLRRRGDHGTLALVNLAGAEQRSGAEQTFEPSWLGTR